MEKCLAGLTMIVLEEIIVQLVDVASIGALLWWDLAVEETSSRGEIDLSLWDEAARGGVFGPEELDVGDCEGLLNRFLATLDPWIGDPPWA